MRAPRFGDVERHEIGALCIAVVVDESHPVLVNVLMFKPAVDLTAAPEEVRNTEERRSA